MQRLKTKYNKEIAPSLKKEFSLESAMAVPMITKTVINVGVGDAVKNKEILEQVKKDLAKITGQMPSTRQAKVSVASFGVRRGMPVGLSVTLRGERMYAFLDRLFSIVLPRLRDFRGVSRKSFDKHGNYTLGIEDYSVFPEIDMTKSNGKGLEVTIVTSTKNRDWAYELLSEMGMPFEKEEN